jgi:hypothetical protein
MLKSTRKLLKQKRYTQIPQVWLIVFYEEEHQLTVGGQ